MIAVDLVVAAVREHDFDALGGELELRLAHGGVVERASQRGERAVLSTPHDRVGAAVAAVRAHALVHLATGDFDLTHAFLGAEHTLEALERFGAL